MTDTVNEIKREKGGIAPKTLTEEVNDIDGIITGFCFNRERKQQSFTKNLRQECRKTTFCKISYLERHRFHDTLTEKEVAALVDGQEVRIKGLVSKTTKRKYDATIKLDDDYRYKFL